MKAKPILSIVISTLGRDTIIRTIQSISTCRSFDEAELLLIGNIQVDEVLEAVQKYVARHDNIRHIPARFPTGDMCAKRNLGFDHAKADIVVFTDDDVVVAEDWINEIVTPFDDQSVGVVSGPSLVPDDLNLMPRAAGLALSSVASGYVSRRYLKSSQPIKKVSGSEIIGCNMAFRRTVLEEIGQFDLRLGPGDDLLAGNLVKKNGYEIVFNSRAYLYHYPRSSLTGFWRQITGYGVARIRLMRMGIGREITTLVPLLMVITGALLFFGGFLIPLMWILLAGLALTYLCVCMILSIFTVIQTGKFKNFIVFFLIPVMHAGYGIAQFREMLFPGMDLNDEEFTQGKKI